MNIVVLNGSPRPMGNTRCMINRFVKGLNTAYSTDIITLSDKNIQGCIACFECAQTHICSQGDDTQSIIDTLIKADVIIFASPVYWWGLSSHLKLLIDKFICNVEGLSQKKVGLLLVGASETSNTQYRIIGEQFSCISVYLKWDVMFQRTVSSGTDDSISDNEAFLSELESLASML